MTIYLRFLSDTITYMKGSFPSKGLGLTDAEVQQVKDKAVARVQTLFTNAMANVTVTHTEPNGLNMPNANEDGVVIIDVVAKQGEPTRRWNDSGTAIVGQAPINELNWVDALFGMDAIGPNNGVFINRLPLITDKGMRVTIDQIATGIGNVAAHEAGHAMGMVPNSTSTNLKSTYKDERFSNVTFDGDTKHHAGSSGQDIMAAEQVGPSTDPPILKTTLSFRSAPKDKAYLQAVLPR
jgi:hypothetical protein